MQTAVLQYDKVFVFCTVAPFILFNFLVRFYIVLTLFMFTRSPLAAEAAATPLATFIVYI